MGINKEREDFEAEFSKIKSDIAFWLHTWDEEMQGYNHPVMCWFWHMWQAAKAQAVPEGFFLIKDDTKTVVAIERMVEQQVEASGMDSRRLERLDGWKIIEAAVKAQEPAND